MLTIMNFMLIFMLVVTTNAATLTCDFDPTTFACKIISLEVNQINEAIAVINPPFPDYFDGNTTALQFDALNSNVLIKEFPRIFGIFSSLQSFSAYNISMTELPTDAFYNCAQLTDVNIYYSVIGDIRGKIASTCSSLINFNIFDSKITSINEEAFEGMTSLFSLVIQQSQLSCIPPKLFQPLTSLKYLHLPGNNLTALHPLTFKGMVKLRLINLHSNQIKCFPCFDFNTTGIYWVEELTSLYLGLEDNPIKSICPTFVESIYKARMSDSTKDYPTEQIHIFFQAPPVDPVPTCIDPSYSNFDDDYFKGVIARYYTIGTVIFDWVPYDSFLRENTTCYSAWTSECWVPCDEPATTELTTSTIETMSSTLEPSSTTVEVQDTTSQKTGKKRCYPIGN